ncbi:MAG: cupin domain-containing protein [Acidobacteriota bacterium]|nr:cupin domain-containing protein [Acidobacteriota bacterium]
MKSLYRIERWRQVYAPNPAMLRHIMESEGYTVFQWSDRPDAVHGLHKHGEEQSHWIVSGKLELMIEAVGTFVLEAGDRDFMPAHTYHTARVLSEEAVVYLVGEKIK